MSIYIEITKRYYELTIISKIYFTKLFDCDIIQEHCYLRLSLYMFWTYHVIISTGLIYYIELVPQNRCLQANEITQGGKRR